MRTWLSLVRTGALHNVFNVLLQRVNFWLNYLLSIVLVLCGACRIETLMLTFIEACLLMHSESSLSQQTTRQSRAAARCYGEYGVIFSLFASSVRCVTVYCLLQFVVCYSLLLDTEYCLFSVLFGAVYCLVQCVDGYTYLLCCLSTCTVCCHYSH